MNIHTRILLLCFVSFFLGYFSWYWFVPTPSTIVPDLCGKSLLEGLTLASEKHVSLCILKKELYPSLPEGTIIDQIPYAGSTVKIDKPCFITIAIHPPSSSLPLTGLSVNEIKKICDKQGITASIVYLPCPQATPGTCFAQTPHPTEPLTNKQVTCYIAKQPDQHFIMPQLTNLSVKTIQTYAQEHTWTLDIVYKHDPTIPFETELVIDQRPLAGSIIKEQNSFFVQILVAQNIHKSA